MVLFLRLFLNGRAYKKHFFSTFVYKWKICLFLSVCLLARFTLPGFYCRFYQCLFYFISCPNEDYLPKTFDFRVNLLSEPSKCDDDVKLLIFVPSVARKNDERTFIRETWARQFVGQKNVKMIFAVASDKNSFKSLEKESFKRMDLLLFDFEEHYHNISLKIFNVLKWISKNCPKVSHILRADPDIVLLKRGIEDFLTNHATEQMTIYGYCRNYDCVMRYPYSKTCMPRSWYPYHWYPKYCFGFSYIFTGDLLKELLPLWHKRPYFPLDDILFTGLLAEESRVKINRLDYKYLFDYQRRFDQISCDVKQIAAAAYEDLTEARLAWSRYSLACQILL